MRGPVASGPAGWPPDTRRAPHPPTAAAGSTAAGDMTGIAPRLQNRDENQGCPRLSIPWARSPRNKTSGHGRTAGVRTGTCSTGRARGGGHSPPVLSGPDGSRLRSPVAIRGLCPQPCPSTPRPSGPPCGPYVLLAAPALGPERPDLPQTRFKLPCRGHTVAGA